MTWFDLALKWGSWFFARVVYHYINDEFSAPFTSADNGPYVRLHCTALEVVFVQFTRIRPLF